MQRHLTNHHSAGLDHTGLLARLLFVLSGYGVSVLGNVAYLGHFPFVLLPSGCDGGICLDLHGSESGEVRETEAHAPMETEITSLSATTVF